jgi:hypothetical protein
MTLPTPEESASMLMASIKPLVPSNHNTQAQLLIAIAQHIAADRSAHCRHVAVNATSLIDHKPKGTK